jgi:MFS family permease
VGRERRLIRDLILPPLAAPGAGPVLAARAIRAFGDGYVAVLLPAYLLSLGLGEVEIGAIGSVTLLGSAIATTVVGALAGRVREGRLLAIASCLMAATGLALVGFDDFVPLLLVAFFGTLNPGGGDTGAFLPLEHARLAACAEAPLRTALFARYGVAGYLPAAFGSLTAALPGVLESVVGIAPLDSMRAMFGFYGLMGIAVWHLYRTTSTPDTRFTRGDRPAALGESRAVVTKLAALFSVDAFAGGLVVNSLLALWLFERFGMALESVAVFLFWTGLLSAASQLAAAAIAKRIGLLNTMVFTHIPASLLLVVAALSSTVEVALGALILRAGLSQMDVPARNAYVMAVVTPAERPAAASFTTVPRSLAASAGPSVTGLLLASGSLAAPLVACGLLKIAYDLTLLAAFRKVSPRAVEAKE